MIKVEWILNIIRHLQAVNSLYILWSTNYIKVLDKGYLAGVSKYSYSDDQWNQQIKTLART